MGRSGATGEQPSFALKFAPGQPADPIDRHRRSDKHPDRAGVDCADRLATMSPSLDSVETANAAGAMTFEAKASGLTRIDHALQSTNGTGLFAVQGALNDPVHSRVHLDKSQAAAEPIVKSTVQVQQETQPQLQAQQEREQRRTVTM